MKGQAGSARGRGIRDVFVILYLIVQITVPLGGLVLAHRISEPVRFSWHMFSRIPVPADE